jgi:hypothetical protein
MALSSPVQLASFLAPLTVLYLTALACFALLTSFQVYGAKSTVEYTAAVDMWGLGILLLQLLMCTYHNHMWEDIIKVATEGHSKRAYDLLRIRSKGDLTLVSLCIQLLSKDPKTRPGYTQVKEVLEYVLAECRRKEQMQRQLQQQLQVMTARVEAERAAAAMAAAQRRAEKKATLKVRGGGCQERIIWA